MSRPGRTAQRSASRRDGASSLALPSSAWQSQQPACCPPPARHPLPSPCPAAAVSLDLQKMGSKYLWGKACIAECIQYDGARKRTKVHLIPRPTSRADAAAAAAGRRVFETEPFFSFHHANAFEDAASGRVVIDTVANHDGIDFSANFETVGGRAGVAHLLVHGFWVWCVPLHLSPARRHLPVLIRLTAIPCCWCLLLLCRASATTTATRGAAR